MHWNCSKIKKEVMVQFGNGFNDLGLQILKRRRVFASIIGETVIKIGDHLYWLDLY
jgi:hypothetical protein